MNSGRIEQRSKEQVNKNTTTSNIQLLLCIWQHKQQKKTINLKQSAFIWMWEHYIKLFFDSTTCMMLSLLGKVKNNRGMGHINSLGSKFSKWLIPNCVLATTPKSISELASLRVNIHPDSSLITLHPGSLPEKKQQGLEISHY